MNKKLNNVQTHSLQFLRTIYNPNFGNKKNRMMNMNLSNILTKRKNTRYIDTRYIKFYNNWPRLFET